MEQPPVSSQFQQPPSQIPFRLALTANILNFLLSIPFYWVRSGAHIRPLAWLFLTLCISVAGFVALPLVIPAFRRRKQRVWLWLTMVLALTPLPLAVSMLHLAAWLKGFELAP